jgi:hypothetical protein
MAAQIILSLTIAIITVCDAARDAWLHSRKPGVGWWEWHIVKWVAFYIPLVWLCMVYLPLWWTLLLALLCYGLWNLVYNKLSN